MTLSRSGRPDAIAASFVRGVRGRRISRATRWPGAQAKDALLIRRFEIDEDQGLLGVGGVDGQGSAARGDDGLRQDVFENI